MKFRVAGIAEDSIVDGPGLRLAVFFQGCPYDCPGCHNPHTHDFEGGREEDTDTVITMLKANPLLDGLTLTGGEPLAQPEAALLLARAAKEMGKNVWAYTGSTYEQLIEKQDEHLKALLPLIDVLVDGPFVEAQKSLALPWRGSANQRLVDVRNSMKTGSVQLWTPPVW